MKTLSLLLICAGLAVAQVPTVPNTDHATFRTNLNLSLGRAVDANGSYTNPSFIVSIPYSKITGAPTLWGTGSKAVAANALGVAGNCVVWSVVGLGDAGAPCGSGGGGYGTVSGNGTPVTARGILNFSTEFTVADNSGATRTDISLNSVDAGKILSGALAKARQHAATVYNDQANTYTTGAQDFSAATSLRVPNAAGYTPTLNGHFGYDTTSNTFKGYTGASVHTFAFLDSNVATATALAGTPTKCSAGNYPLGVDAQGNAQNCTATGAGNVVNTNVSVDPTNQNCTAGVDYRTNTTASPSTLWRCESSSGGVGVWRQVVDASGSGTTTVTFVEGSASAIPSPPSGSQSLVIDTDHVAKLKNSSGTLTPLVGGAAGSGGVTTHTGSYTITSSDTGTHLYTGATSTATLPATVPATGFIVSVKSGNATGLVLDPNGNAITGCVSTPIAMGHEVLVQSNGANYICSAAGEILSVKDFGAVGDGTTDDTTAITNAFATACARVAPRVVFPAVATSYLVTGTIQLCEHIEVFGYGHTSIHYTGTGALFNLAGNINGPQIHGLQLVGNSAANQVAINLQGNSGIVVQGHFHDLFVYNFGDVATHSGAGIRFQGNGAISVSITNVDMSNDGDDIRIDATTDSLNVSESTLYGTAKCINITTGSGAGTVSFRHNNMGCLGGSTFNPTFANIILADNEYEIVAASTNANSAAFEFLGGSVYLDNNMSTVHNHANYDFYIGDGVVNSRIYGNQGGGSNTNVFRVGTGTGNVYFNNQTVGTALYSNAAYTGIMAAPISGTPGARKVLDGAGTWLSMDVSQNSQSAAYTTVLADSGKHILHPTADNNARTFTIDSNANVAYPIGTTITFINQINTVTIAITSDTLQLAGTATTGSRTLAAGGMAVAIKVTATLWFISGQGLT